MDSDRTNQGPAGSRWYTRAALVAVAGLLIAGAWAVVALVPVMSDIDDLPRGGVPGELTVSLGQPAERVVYYERHRWFVATPLDPDLAIEVTGPAGMPVEVPAREVPVGYRMPGLVGEAQATFEATAPGDYTVSVEGDVADDATVAVGPSITASTLGRLWGPVAVAVVTATAAAVLLSRSARSRGG